MEKLEGIKFSELCFQHRDTLWVLVNSTYSNKIKLLTKVNGCFKAICGKLFFNAKKSLILFYLHSVFIVACCELCISVFFWCPPCLSSVLTKRIHVQPWNSCLRKIFFYHKLDLPLFNSEIFLQDVHSSFLTSSLSISVFML